MSTSAGESVTWPPPPLDPEDIIASATFSKAKLVQLRPRPRRATPNTPRASSEGFLPKLKLSDSPLAESSNRKDA
ncbi:hypothetical protein H2204_001743 [Knufia peltigerae]|uniref:Uncharacterized protein n=1 Tax=Knufia peltigerae TaxID=1002370 RepID=A0AA38YDB5_9EURO|nr:hypothetical protein H2204_001743 [Knufia peltigerae]